ncbi:MAG: hypothetical protein OHK0046_06870 [Anaerolineae bacterium]
MLVVALNAVFALLAFTFSRNAYRRALPFIRLGWQTIDAAVQQPGYRHNIESRRAISEAGRFLIGGIIWLLIALAAVAAGVYFTWQVVVLYR